jgi:endonuclease/exonuclease/phosphatase family metal-dependent hydrolase
VQVEEVKQLAEFLESLTPRYPIIITGDFNSIPTSAAVRTLLHIPSFPVQDLWTECGQGNGYTFNSSVPWERIDYIFSHPPLQQAVATTLSPSHHLEIKPITATSHNEKSSVTWKYQKHPMLHEKDLMLSQQNERHDKVSQFANRMVCEEMSVPNTQASDHRPVLALIGIE